MIKHVSFEVFPSDKLKLDLIPESWQLAITCISEEVQPTLDLYKKLGPPVETTLSGVVSA